MTQVVGQWLVFILAIILANLPFISERVLGVVRLPQGKGGWWRVFEVLTGYFIVGTLGVLIESNVGLVHVQNWEFYALTACVFLVLAFPGFVYRFLWRSPKGGR